ncbi:MAG: hypothetical protein V3U88_04240 [Methylococcales bacterium]
MNFKNKILALLTLLAITLPVTPVWAHGGVSVEIDSCRIPVGDQWVHFTAYTPDKTGDAEFCNTIPDQARANLVFDYEGRKLRKMTVEFEITKEPEGTVIYHQDAASHPTGTVNAVVDFTKHPTGSYLAHVTLINGEERTDAHLPFSVGAVGPSASDSLMMVVMLLGVLVGAYFFVPAVREKVDGVIKGNKPDAKA